jgi:nucleoside phosphorylase
MNVLLVEDNDSKSFQIEEALREAIPSVRIDRAKSFRSAVRFLEAKAFDLLVLDLMLPIRDGDKPTEQGGKDVLLEIMEGQGCRKPSHIICATAFEEMANSFQTEAARKLVHVVTYDEVSSAWRGPFVEKARIIESRLRDANKYPSRYGVDLAIVTSSPHVELQEVLRLPGFTGEFHQTDVLHYFSADWESASGRTLRVIACAAPTMGMTAACVTACKVIERWRPQFLTMTGIAAGTKSDQHFGDVLVAEAAYDYGSGKIAETDAGERVFMPSPNQIRIDPELHAILQKWEREQSRMADVQKNWYSKGNTVPQLILGILATGAAVVQDRGIVDDILRASRKVVGLDMEAYAIFQACSLTSHPRPRVLVAKAVSDFADKRKDDSAQQYAAFTSAHFIHQFFTNVTELSLGTE